MATIDKNLIHFNRLADFETRLAAGDIRDYSIVCIKDAKLIWTHGEYYGDLSECLKVTQQTLTDEEKTQVLENLGIEIPTKVSDLENDKGFVSATDIGEEVEDPEVSIEGGDYLPLTGGTISGDLIINAGEGGLGNLDVAADVTAGSGFHGRWFPVRGSYELGGSSNGFEIRYTAGDEKVGELIFNGDGTKFLANDGSYKTIETDSSSGSAAYPLVEHGTSDTTFTLTPNTFHVWDEVASLDLSFGDETSGVANEYLFQFTSGATATTLTLPDDIKWADDAAPTIAENMIYQCSIVNDIGIFVEVSSLISFAILGVSYVASDGMTWEQWCNSDYNTVGYTISGGKVFIGGSSYVSLEDEFVSSTDTIKANYAYTTTSNEPV